MKVTFVYPDITAVDPYWKGGYYVGVSSLSAQIKARGHTASLIHILNPYYGREDFLKDLEKDGHSDLYAFSCTTLGFPWVRRWCQWLHDEGIHVPTICGGSHPSVDAEHAIQADHLDMICLGEGEGAMCDLVEALEQGKPYHEIPNLWVKHDGEIHRNALRPLIPDLDVLEHADREIWTNWEELYWEKQGYAAVVASRGCPFKCTYCVNHTYMELFPDKQYVRFRSPDNTIDELKGILNKYPHIHGFNFDDDILYMQRPWSIEFTEKYKKEIGLPFYCNMRPNVCKP
ncbi:MAG: cobalamin-dependent protein, partial [Myxococcales bacterium]|nr:cobalamin-dependent protein [Myxococcales bacterium]